MNSQHIPSEPVAPAARLAIPSSPHRSNNFDSMRILAAVAVIYGHSHVLAGAAPVTMFGNAVESLAVKVFFAISGFLVAASWLSDPHPFRYLARRGLRIFPGLIVLLLVTAFVIGPLVTILTTRDYFASGAHWSYITYNLSLYPSYSLPGVFPRNISPAVNGSLWSLPVEFLMYLVFPAVLVVSRWARSNLFLILFTFVLCAVSLYLLRISPMGSQVVFYGSTLRGVLDTAPYFFIGALFSVTALRTTLSPTVTLFMIAALVLLQPTGALAPELSLFIVLPYAVLSFAVQSTPYLSRAGRFGDPSYGIYLYGFLVQQVVYHYAGRFMPPLHNTLVSVVVAALLAYASWHLVEKQALKIRPRARRDKLPAATSAEPTDPDPARHGLAAAVTGTADARAGL